MRGEGGPSLIEYWFCHMKHSQVFKHFHFHTFVFNCTLRRIDIKCISLGSQEWKFKNAIGLLLIFWLVVNHNSQVCGTWFRVRQSWAERMHLAKLKVSNKCLSLRILRKQKQTLSVPPSFKKIMYFLLCTMHNETQESDALQVANKNAQCQKGRICFRVKKWLCPTHFLKENRQKWLLLSFWSYTKDLIGMEACKLWIQLFGESFTNKTFIIGWKTFWTGFKIQD